MKCVTCLSTPTPTLHAPFSNVCFHPCAGHTSIDHLCRLPSLSAFPLIAFSLSHSLLRRPSLVFLVYNICILFPLCNNGADQPRAAERPERDAGLRFSQPVRGHASHGSVRGIYEGPKITPQIPIALMLVHFFLLLFRWLVYGGGRGWSLRFSLFFLFSLERFACYP